MTYIITYPPSGARAFNTARIALHHQPASIYIDKKNVMALLGAD
jgi:hypothetical protein